MRKLLWRVIFCVALATVSFLLSLFISSTPKSLAQYGGGEPPPQEAPPEEPPPQEEAPPPDDGPPSPPDNRGEMPSSSPDDNPQLPTSTPASAPPGGSPTETPDTDPCVTFPRLPGCGSGSDPPVRRYDISGMIWYDYDQNRKQNDGEPGLDGVRIKADGQDDKGHTDTKNKGKYEIKNLLEGRYKVEAILRGGFRATTKNPRLIGLRSNVRDVNFGFFRGWEIEGRVFNDISGDGKRDGWEPGVGGVRVIGQNIKINQINDRDMTTANGHFLLNKDLPEGNYDVKIDRNSVNRAQYDIVGNGQIRVEIGGNKGNERNADIPLRGKFSISGRVFIDNNGNGIYESTQGDEPWLGQPEVTFNNDSRPVTKNANGTYSIQNLASGTYSVGFVPPTGYIMVHPKPPSYSVKPGINCQPSSATPGGVCNGNDIEDLNFAITQSQSWLQGYGLDLRFDKGLTNSMPQTANASCGGGAFVSAPASGTTPGLVFSGQLINPRGNFGQGQASAPPYNWLVGGTYQETYSGAGSILATNFDQVKAKLKGSSIIPKPLKGAVAGCSDLASCTLTGLPQGVYEAAGDVTLNAWTVPANTRYVILVGGTLRINGIITVPRNQKAFLTFIVKGDIIVTANVGGVPAPTSCPAPDVSQLDGFYSTDKSFILQSASDCTTERMLSMQGALVVNARRGGGTFQNNRDLCGNNAFVPSFTIRERLDMILNTPEVLKTQNFLYQEVAP